MFEKGDKFVIEIADVIEGSRDGEVCKPLYIIKGMKNLVFNEYTLNGLEYYEEEIEVNANDYIRGLHDGYTVGCDDAWGLAKKLVDHDEMAQKVFKNLPVHSVLSAFSGKEAVKKVKRYRDREEDE